LWGNFDDFLPCKELLETNPKWQSYSTNGTNGTNAEKKQRPIGNKLSKTMKEQQRIVEVAVKEALTDSDTTLSGNGTAVTDAIKDLGETLSTIGTAVTKYLENDMTRMFREGLPPEKRVALMEEEYAIDLLSQQVKRKKLEAQLQDLNKTLNNN
jgi:hypothetical protein